MTPELLAELIARRESETLDFKVKQYEWTADGNLELAKDLMAIANGLSPTASPGYILIGVEAGADQTGRLVGVESHVHLDDAAMHEKVKFLLNRTPLFQYAPFEIEGKTVGVFEIRPGGRPYYPLKTQGSRHKLSRFEARIRAGSSTDTASPEQIQAWVREDDTELRELRRIEIEAKESQLIVCPRLTVGGFRFAEDKVARNDLIAHELVVHNFGESRLSVVEVTQTWRLTEAFYRDMASNSPKSADFDLVISGEPPVPVLLAPGQFSSFNVTLSAIELGEYIRRATDLRVASSNWHTWVDGGVAIKCEGVTGRTGVAKASYDMGAFCEAVEAERTAEAERRRARLAAQR